MKNLLSCLLAWAGMTTVWLVVMLGFWSCNAGAVVPSVATFFYAIFCLILLFHVEMPSWWNEYRDIAITSGVLVSVTAGGLIFVWSQAECLGASFAPCAGFAAMLWAVAYLAGGFAIGFIFGIPRVDQPQDAAKNLGAVTNSSETGSGYSLRVNTNLEQVSDWLTKIIVGVGLVEMKKTPSYIHIASDWLARSFYRPEANDFLKASSFATSIILFFSIVGALAGYLITRLFFAGAFGRADSKTYIQPTTFVLTTAPTDSRSKIRNYWAPGGVAESENEKKLTDWLSTNNIHVSLASFVSSAKFEKQRIQAIKDLNIT